MLKSSGYKRVGRNLKTVIKLSQNRDEKSYGNILSKLEEQGGNSGLIAEEMKKRKPEFFPPGAE